jgi:hypothetical protein
VLQVVCDVNKIFGTFVLANFEGFMMVDNWRSVAYMYNWSFEKFSKNQLLPFEVWDALHS